jgi:hypothetical protein
LKKGKNTVFQWGERVEEQQALFVERKKELWIGVFFANI